MWRVLVLIAGVGCSHPAPPPQPAPPPPKPKTRAQLEKCEHECNRVVMSRHDACGRFSGPPWPDWCASDNERMFDNCELTCLE